MSGAGSFRTQKRRNRVRSWFAGSRRSGTRWEAGLGAAPEPTRQQWALEILFCPPRSSPAPASTVPSSGSCSSSCSSHPRNRHQNACLQGPQRSAARSCGRRRVSLGEFLCPFTARPSRGEREFAPRGTGAWRCCKSMAGPERGLRAPDRLDGYATQVSAALEG